MDFGFNNKKFSMVKHPSEETTKGPAIRTFPSCDNSSFMRRRCLLFGITIVVLLLIVPDECILFFFFRRFFPVLVIPGPVAVVFAKDISCGGEGNDTEDETNDDDP